MQGPTEVLLDCMLQVGIIIASGLSQAREVPGKCMDLGLCKGSSSQQTKQLSSLFRSLCCMGLLLD